MSRYEISGGEESQYQAGADNKVLRNKLGITSVIEMDRAESLALADAKSQVLTWFADDTVITLKTINDLYSLWLSPIYSFTGRYRTVNMSKPGITFCVAEHIPSNMLALENDYLIPLTPCRNLDLVQVCHRVAKVHAELLLIHPFREGNGRLARWVADLMVMQAGFPAPSYDIFGSNAKPRLAAYFAALRKGYFSQDVSELSQLFQGWVLNAKGDPL